MSVPDPRRVDLRASVQNIWQQLLVRTYRQDCAVPVYVLADLSASMDFRGTTHKLDMLSDLTAAAGYSTFRTGDPFGFIGFDERICREYFHPAMHDRAAGMRIATQLRGLVPAGGSSRGIVAAARGVGARPSLVFIVSDFHFAPALAAAALAALTPHLVVPVVLSDSTEHRSLPRYGLARVVDRETGHKRTLLLRRSLNERIERRFQAQRRALHRLCVRHGTRPLYIEDVFCAEFVTRYFYG